MYIHVKPHVGVVYPLQGKAEEWLNHTYMLLAHTLIYVDNSLWLSLFIAFLLTNVQMGRYSSVYFSMVNIIRRSLKGCFTIHT